VEKAADIDWARLTGVRSVGLTAGASAPEILVDQVIAALRERYTLVVKTVMVTREDTVFSLPKALVG
jgi:4-hydroxy-3-methylbut-2-enyl diphosphate reductase